MFYNHSFTQKKETMAQTISVNVYAINNIAQSTISKMGFPTGTSLFRPAVGVQTYNGVRVYASIQAPDGAQYSTVETVAQLASLANA